MTSGRSTSRHTLSADGGLPKSQRLYWLACNILNNAFPRSHVDGKIRERRFLLSQPRLDELWSRVAPDASPSRRLSDLFWLSLPWESVLQEAGRINAFEAGCGSGTYGRLLDGILGTNLEKYLGVDIKPHESWTSPEHSRIAFAVGRASDSSRFLGSANLVLTQSALEHFEEDQLYFSQVSKFVLETRRPVLQIHLIPSASCISTFPWHGIREYTPRTISRVTELFGPETRVYLYSLGGTACNRIHRQFITWPRLRRGQDLRQSRAQDYVQCVRSAILADFAGGARGSAFYALILLSNFDRDPFAGGTFE